MRLALGNDPEAIPVTLTEEDIRLNYPWDYNKLTENLRHRYSDFKSNQRYHEIRIPLKGDTRYAMCRYLDPDNQNSSRKTFYSPNILNVSDEHYNRD